MEFLIVLLLLALLAAFVTMPLRRRRTSSEAEAREALRVEREVQDLEAAREAKYREIRDAELDHGTGKLSDADWQAVDRSLRADAIAILRDLDRANDALRRRRADAAAE